MNLPRSVLEAMQKLRDEEHGDEEPSDEEPRPELADKARLRVEEARLRHGLPIADSSTDTSTDPSTDESETGQKHEKAKVDDRVSRKK